MKTARTTLTRLTLLAAAAAVPVVAIATPALADTHTSTAPTAAYVGAGTGLTGVVPDSAGARWPAGTFKFTLAGTPVETFCVQFNVTDVDKTGTYTTQSWAASGVKNLAKAADIAAHHTTLGTPNSDAQFEDAAAQTAIWSLTDNVNVAGIGNAAFIARVNELLTDATQAAEPLTPAKITTGVARAGVSSEKVTAVLLSSDGTAIPGAPLTFTIGSTTQQQTTAADGTASITVPAASTAQPATVTYTGQIAAGTVLTPTNGQKMITTSAVALTRSAALTVPAAVAAPVVNTPSPLPSVSIPPEKAPVHAVTATPTPSATAKPAPAPTQKAEPKQLAYTGSSATAELAIGALLLAAGLGLLARKALRHRS